MNIQGVVRAFRPEDRDQAAEIWLAANTSAHAFLPAEVWQEHLPDLRNALVQATVFVCEREGRLCGFIGLQGSYIAGLFVDPKLQGQGIGSLLLSECQKRFDCLSLDVFAENPRAKRFYEQHGFSAGEPKPSGFPPHLEHRMEWQKNA